MFRVHPQTLFAPATDEGALAAITAAIENPGGAPASTTTDDGGGNGGDQGGAGGEAAGGEGGEARSSDGGDPGTGAAAGAGAQGEPDGGEGADGGKGGKKGAGAEETATPDPDADRGDGRNAAGRFVKAKGETDEQLAARRTADPLDGKKPGQQPDPAAKKADHVNDPIPAELKGRTRERLEGLVSVAKELDTKLKAVTAEVESGRELFGMIEATGADAATFARHMDVLSLMCSQDPADQQKAVAALRAAADKLGAELGETPLGKDPLEGHQDLIDEVDAGETTRKRAEEIAKFRNSQAAAERKRTEASQRTTEQDAAAQARQKTIDALNVLSDELRGKDGKELYNRKHALLVPMIKRLNHALPPEKIVAAVREAYDALQLAPAPAANGNRAPAGSGSRQPARATQGAGGGGSKVPSTPMEALEFGLEEHARATGAR